MAGRGRELNEIIFQRRLASSGARAVDLRTARARASAFAARYFRGFANLRARGGGLIDHGAFKEYRFRWQARRGRAWLPVEAVVGVNATSGRVSYYWSQRGPGRNVDVTPRISAKHARSRATHAVSTRGGAKIGRPELTVVRRPAGGADLVWSTHVKSRATRTSAPQAKIVETDADTGATRVVASAPIATVTGSPAAEAATASALTSPQASANETAAAPDPDQTGPAYGSCYDAKYFDGVTSRYTANKCDAALTAAGYKSTAYHNVNAQKASENSATDAVFFHYGHTILHYDSCDPTCSGPFTAVGMLYQDALGTLSMLTANAFDAANYTYTGKVQICNEDGTKCKTQNRFFSYPWIGDGDSGVPGAHRPNLAVLEGCKTAAQTPQTNSLVNKFSSWGMGTVVGFRALIYSSLTDNSGVLGDKWANVFWADLRAGQTYNVAIVDASNAVGNTDGYGSWVELRNTPAPNSLYPASYR